jgi:dCMP deaminase
MAGTDWDQRFLGLAKHVARWSKDPNARIGAVIVDANRRVISTGYNGLPTKVADSLTRLKDAKTKNEMVVHAETNAIIEAGKLAAGSTIYVYGKPTCSKCAGAIIQAGIKRIVAPPPKKNTTSKWDRSGMASKRMFAEAGVEFVSGHGFSKDTRTP